jgi:formamidopyrimidine-DNA glycosylase
MPELPEVETVRLQLLHKILNKPIEKTKVFNQKIVGNDINFSKKLKGKSFINIDRIGKLLIFSFKNEKDLFLLTHLKMTGQFFYVDKNEVVGGGHSSSTDDSKNLPNKHTRVAFYFTDGTSLFFNDMRMFGYIKIAGIKEVETAKAKFGQEPISDDFNFQKLFEKIKRKNTSIKATLLDQTLVAGLGNIYVDEALFIAGILPTRKSSEISEKEIKNIIKSGGKIMNKSITYGGTTFQHFLDTGGETGNYTDFLKVFGKQNTPCPKCKTLIQKTRVAGRGTHFCPNCQK